MNFHEVRVDKARLMIEQAVCRYRNELLK